VTTAQTLRVQRAAVTDVRAIHDLVNGFARRGEMLPRTLAEIYESLRDFSVVHDGGELIACGALHVMWEDLAEIRSLAVEEDRQGHGLGALLVRAHLEEARDLGLRTVFALTYRPAFFEKLGFRQADVMTLPRKVWNECYRCPKFPTCNEIAVVTELEPTA
jgi:amino-acid N-acetyltransferase